MRIAFSFDLDGHDATNWSVDSDGELSMERGIVAMILMRKMVEIQLRELHVLGILETDPTALLDEIDRIGPGGRG